MSKQNKQDSFLFKLAVLISANVLLFLSLVYYYVIYFYEAKMHDTYQISTFYSWAYEFYYWGLSNSTRSGEAGFLINILYAEAIGIIGTLLTYKIFNYLKNR